MIIIENALYYLGKARIEDIVIITSLSIMWIMIRLIEIQTIIEEIEERQKEKVNRD
jgi:hypothetical protein